VDSRRAPTWILLGHLPDMVPNLGAHFRPANPVCPRSPAPEKAATGPLPADNGVGLDDHQSIGPPGPKSTKGNPEELVPLPQARVWPFPFEDDDLLAQGQNFKTKLRAAAEEAANVEEQGNDEL